MNIQTRQQKGFTIIEVVLVLAIAALIFLMVFIALPALQANQRDTERKQDAGIVSSGVTKFVTGERRALVAADTTDLRTYIEDLSLQYENGKDAVSVSADLTAKPAKDEIFVYPASKCDGSVPTAGGATARSASVVVMLDNGENTYCVDAS